MLKVFQETDLNLIHIAHNYPHLALEYNLPLGNHGMKLLLDYDQNSQRIKVHGHAFGHFSGDEIYKVANLFQLEGMLLGVTVKKQPDYSPSSHTMTFIWEIDVRNLNEFAHAFARGIPQYRNMLCHRRDLKDFLYEPIYDNLLKRHSESNYERLKPVLGQMKTDIIASRENLKLCGWKYDGPYIAVEMLEKFGWPIVTTHPEPRDDGTRGVGEQLLINSANLPKNKPKRQSSSKQVIDREEFELILSNYKSRSFLGYLSTFWIFSWISPTRSQTMRELTLLLSLVKDQEIQRKDIADTLKKGDRVAHRLGLFNGKNGVEKDGTGTDEVIVQLNEAINRNGRSLK